MGRKSASRAKGAGTVYLDGKLYRARWVVGGKVFTRAELEFIATLAQKYDAYVITDEVYEHIVYKPFEHVYFSSLPGMYERTISCSSLSKTSSITGLRLG